MKDADTIVDNQDVITHSYTTPQMLEARQNALVFRNQLMFHLAGMVGNQATTIDRAALLKMLTPDRDYNFECGYPDKITKQQYQEQYDREGIATRVVKIYPEETWQIPPSIYETEEADETDWEKAFKTLDNEKHIIQIMEKADVLSGIGRFGVLLIGIDDGLSLDQPVEGVNDQTGEIAVSGRERNLLYIRAFSESSVTIDSINKDQASPRFGMPMMYKINFEESVLGTQQAGTRVHWSRVIHIADNLESSLIYGVPRMQIVFNRLLDARKVLAGSGEMFWKGGFPGYAFEVNPQITEATLDKDSMKEEFWKLSEGLQRYIALEGVTAKSLQPQVADPTGHLTAHVKAIAMSIGVPYRIFLGSEEAKLASTQDKETWHSRIKRRQKNYVSPMIIRPLLDRLIAFGVLKEVEYLIDWEDLDSPSEQDIAGIAKDRTEAMAKYVQGDVETLIPQDEYLSIVHHFSQEEITAISNARDELLGDRDIERERELERRESAVATREKMSQKQELEEQMTAGNEET